MKSILFLLGLLFFARDLFGQTNPQIRICHQFGATVRVFKTAGPSFETLMCDFGGGSEIDARSLLALQSHESRIATATFLRAREPGSLVCSQSGGQKIWLDDLDSRSIQFCLFADRSFLSQFALSEGHKANLQLLDAITNLSQGH